MRWHQEKSILKWVVLGMLNSLTKRWFMSGRINTKEFVFSSSIMLSRYVCVGCGRDFGLGWRASWAVHGSVDGSVHGWCMVGACVWGFVNCLMCLSEVWNWIEVKNFSLIFKCAVLFSTAWTHAQACIHCLKYTTYVNPTNDYLYITIDKGNRLIWRHFSN